MASVYYNRATSRGFSFFTSRPSPTYLETSMRPGGCRVRPRLGWEGGGDSRGVPDAPARLGAEAFPGRQHLGRVLCRRGARWSVLHRNEKAEKFTFEVRRDRRV